MPRSRASLIVDPWLRRLNGIPERVFQAARRERDSDAGSQLDFQSPFSHRQRKSPERLLGTCFPLADEPVSLFGAIPLDGYRHGASPADPISSLPRVQETGRSRRSKYVYNICRRRFTPPGGRPSGIINPCATAAARRALQHRAFSDRRSA